MLRGSIDPSGQEPSQLLPWIWLPFRDRLWQVGVETDIKAGVGDPLYSDIQQLDDGRFRFRHVLKHVFCDIFDCSGRRDNSLTHNRRWDVALADLITHHAKTQQGLE